jgi:hypothetical protein
VCAVEGGEKLKKGIQKIAWLLKYYLWVGFAHNYCVKVTWDRCRKKKKGSGLRLMNLVEAMDALQSKWLLHALEPRDCNLKENIKFHLRKYQHDKGGIWLPNIKWCVQRNDK